MIVKVCGMREPENIAQVAGLGIDLMGFIFYSKSSRYVDGDLVATPKHIGRTGVFVDELQEVIESHANRYNLQYIQLHGGESVELCRELRSKGLKVIKAISVACRADIYRAKEFDGVVDFLLFDTKCSSYGGSGSAFDWSILDEYRGVTPFLLSGGINVDLVQKVKDMRHPSFAGVDLNSRFEIEPALKDVELLKQFINQIR